MILEAIGDLESLWGHLSSPEKTRPPSLLIERFDRDAGDGTFSNTLTLTRLRTLETGLTRKGATG